MLEITKIEELSELMASGFSDWETLGEVNVRLNPSGTLAIFNYSEECTYHRRWNWFERVSRGLILDVQTGEVVARPFDKFFTWWELEEKPTGLPVEVSEKCDGSLGILYREGGEFKVSTRGGFTSSQALWATQYIKNYDLKNLPEEYTLLFEIIYPGNRIIINYKSREDLVLLGVRNRFTGEDLWKHEIRKIAEKFGFSYPLSEDIVDPKLLLERAKTLTEDQEGWVLRYEDGGRVKIKGQKYGDISFQMKKMSDRFIFESLSERGYEETLSEAPEMVQPRVKECFRVFSKVQTRLHDQTMEAFARVSGMGTRREIVSYLMTHCPEVFHWVMAEYQGKSCLPDINYRIQKNYLKYLEEEA